MIDSSIYSCNWQWKPNTKNSPLGRSWRLHGAPNGETIAISASTIPSDPDWHSNHKLGTPMEYTIGSFHYSVVSLGSVRLSGDAYVTNTWPQQPEGQRTIVVEGEPDEFGFTTAEQREAFAKARAAVEDFLHEELEHPRSRRRDPRTYSDRKWEKTLAAAGEQLPDADVLNGPAKVVVDGQSLSPVGLG